MTGSQISKQGSYRTPSLSTPADRAALPDLAGKLLVIEDVADLRHLIRLALKPSGLDIVELASGDAAVALIGKTAPPRLVIVDRMLPFVSGDEIIAGIRADPQWQCVPILAMSAKSRPDDIETVLRAGANAYLTKPFRYQFFRDTVHGLLDRELAEAVR